MLEFVWGLIPRDPSPVHSKFASSETPHRNLLNLIHWVHRNPCTMQPPIHPFGVASASVNRPWQKCGVRIFLSGFFCLNFFGHFFIHSLKFLFSLFFLESASGRALVMALIMLWSALVRLWPNKGALVKTWLLHLAWASNSESALVAHFYGLWSGSSRPLVGSGQGVHPSARAPLLIRKLTG